MRMARSVYNHINQITKDLVGTEICIDQNFPVIKGELSKSCKIEVPNVDVSIALKRQPYRTLFEAMSKSRSFNVRFIDGAMLLLQYNFENDSLVSHRLGFFPNPDMCDFQNNSEDYLEDVIYLDVLDPRVVTTPLRFDYDGREAVVKNIVHPASHLTIGQYENCRIPVSRPLMPSQFVTFITRNFYNTAYVQYCDRISKYAQMFDESITAEESKILHINVRE